MLSIFLFSLLSIGPSSTLAQYVNGNAIGSCADVDCPPTGDDTTRAECRITDKVYGGIGLVSIPTTISQNDLTWTIATQIYDDIDQNDPVKRNIEKDFYLGTPPSLELAADSLPYKGCAVFLYNNSAEFPQNEAGTCSDVIGDECIGALLTQAKTIMAQPQNKSASVEQACQRLQMGLQNTFADPCRSVTGQTSWGQLHAVPITGDKAPTPPSQLQNESSNCHPTLPKTNELALVYGFNDTGTVYSNSTTHMFNAVNLILTVFFSPNSEAQGALESPDAHLSCLKGVYLTNAQLENLSGNENAASVSEYSAGMLVLVAATAFAMLM